MLPEATLKLAQQYQINTEKRFFPVNTMRLYYLDLVSSQTNWNQEAIELTNKLIPKLAALVDVRELVLGRAESLNQVDKQLAAMSAEPISQLRQLLSSPGFNQSINHLLSDIFPLQHSLLRIIDLYNQNPKLTLEDFLTVLRVRAMDSMIYAGAIDQVISQYSESKDGDKTEISPYFAQINQMLQLNDLCDAICYAPDDMKSGNALLIDLVKKIISPELDLYKLFDQVSGQLSDNSPFAKELIKTVKG